MASSSLAERSRLEEEDVKAGWRRVVIELGGGVACVKCMLWHPANVAASSFIVPSWVVRVSLCAADSGLGSDSIAFFA